MIRGPRPRPGPHRLAGLGTLGLLGTLVASAALLSCTRAQPVRVHDLAALLTHSEHGALERRLDQVFRESGVDIQLLIEAAPATLDLRSARRLRELDVGSASPRQRVVLMHYDIADERLRVEIGYGLEEIFPDDWVADLIDRHTRYGFDRGEPALALLMSLRLFEHRLRSAAIAGDFDPHPGSTFEVATAFRSGGAGASAPVPLARGLLDRITATRPLPTESTGSKLTGPAATPDDAHRRWLEWLTSGQLEPPRALFTSESRGLLSEWRLTPALLDFALDVERSRDVDVLEHGDLALIFSRNEPLFAPTFLRRTGDGWQIDARAEREHVLPIAGGEYAWSLRPIQSEFTRAFRDELEWVGPWLRLRSGDNRALPIFRGAATPL